MPRYLQELLRPGTYRLAGGRLVRLSADDLRACLHNTAALQGRGYRVPVLLRHALPGAAEGAPRSLSSRGRGPGGGTAEVGWLVELRQAAAGSLWQEIEIVDSAVVQAIERGACRHTSAELRSELHDSRGHTLGPLVAHVALTSQPRFTAQGPLVAANSPEVCLSSLMNGVFPMSGLIADAAAPLASPEAVASPLPPEAPGESLCDVTRVQLAQRIRASRRLPRGLRESLAAAVEAVQFSSHDDGQPLLKAADAVDLLERSLPEQLVLAAEEFERAGHPQGEAFFSGDPRRVSSTEAARIAAEQLAASGFGRHSR